MPSWYNIANANLGGETANIENERKPFKDEVYPVAPTGVELAITGVMAYHPTSFRGFRVVQGRKVLPSVSN
jgi:hypothetical protein